MKSLEELYLLGALMDDCRLSDPIGYQMARLPLDPVCSKALILASQFKCLEEMLITVAMLSTDSIFYTPREKSEEVVFCFSFCFMLLLGFVITLKKQLETSSVSLKFDIIAM